MDQDKLDFIDDELQDWARWIHEKLIGKFTQLDIGFTDELIKSLGFDVFNGGGLNDGEYKLSFLEYGRLVDMGVGRGRKQGIADNRRAYAKESGGKIRKPKKFYSKTTYGGLNRLINQLVNGYQPAIINTIKNNLEK